ncbi:hypothetical protein SAMN05216490_3571 [Mucilaginibacter mallensis]|uniref:Uncharacterized protein n=1 Tax=Mucilaginibacter mallensis TaxID=652787 RepID=A0A1H2AK04_MUCMA|nr:hypothetical protein SAMN05216490_3571 [Mucilaginibacter mallensis]
MLINMTQYVHAYKILRKLVLKVYICKLYKQINRDK